MVNSLSPGWVISENQPALPTPLPLQCGFPLRNPIPRGKIIQTT